MDPLLLAIDTSTEIAGLALYDGETVCEVTWDARRNQTETLLAQVDHFLALNGRTVQDLRAVGVAIGPGTFNGLRVGMSVAKGLCFGLEIPIVGVVTLDIVAYPHAGARRPIRAFVPAGRKRAVFADYRYRNSRWTRLSELRNEPFARLADGLVDKTVVTGEMTAELEATVAANPLAVIPTPALRARRPSYLAELAFRRWRDGEVDELATLEPLYVHGGSARAAQDGSARVPSSER